MPDIKYAVEIYPLAFDDLDGIYRYYYEESQDEAVSKKVTEELKARIYGLAFMPKKNPLARERRLKKDGFRKLICDNYVIPFLIDEEKKIVSVVRVFHAKMNYIKYL
ncbi:MAG: type II toxin-antitoxin system RelE/ParE family toxin [Clostridiales bacterium]|jgi:plasmid stabilization system protein ParE|nr:type II toxin-antitoxin system RelE/ParE family toxin [Clostridiales bacterium]